MSRVLRNPWTARTLVGFAGVSGGAGMVWALGEDGARSGSLAWLLFGLAVLTGVAKTGTA